MALTALTVLAGRSGMDPWVSLLWEDRSEDGAVEEVVISRRDGVMEVGNISRSVTYALRLPLPRDQGRSRAVR